MEALAKLAPPVLEFVLELVGVLAKARTKRDAARAAIVLGTKRLLLRDTR